MSTKQRKNTRIVLITVIFVLGMFAFGFALVPLYDVFCKVTGLNGKTGAAVVYNNPIIDQDRWVTVEFVATNNADLPWKFYPLVTKIRIHPGENKRIAFFAENLSSHAMTVQAIPSVTPSEAAKYLKKTECFCFSQQTLKSGEALDLPVIFHVDPELPKHIKTFTLAYTLFDAGNFKAREPSQTGRITL